MAGLDLETFLRLLRADVGAWLSLGVILFLLALMAWTSWGSRRALRKCLVLSVLVHFGLVFYGGSIRGTSLLFGSVGPEPPESSIRQIRVTPQVEGDDANPDATGRGDGRPGKNLAAWDRPPDRIALADSGRVARPERVESAPIPRRAEVPPPALSEAAPDVAPPEAASPDGRPELDEPPAMPDAKAAPASPDDVAEVVVRREDGSDPVALPAADRLRPGRLGPARAVEPDRKAPQASPLPEGRVADPEPAAIAEGIGANPTLPDDPEPARPVAPDRDPRVVARRPQVVTPAFAVPERDLRRQARPDRRDGANLAVPGRLSQGPGPVAMARVTPSGMPRPPEIRGAIGGRPLADVPEVYRVRLDPNRSAKALRAGASPASEQAVERALDWLARHQDADGRWNAGVVRYHDGTPAAGDEDFTVHCPPGEVCFGPCHYAEADSAMTGLALLAFLGAGYTHLDGDHADTVQRGIDYLLLIQKPDGDLRGASRNVGNYCHAMATLALCEAYALTADDRLRGPVERAIGFIARGRVADGRGWRYEPGYPYGGDTSILGWMVLSLKSAKVGGIDVPGATRDGALGWLDDVAKGEESGLASYRSARVERRAEYLKVTPTMTAEAWVCRQFLGVGGPGPASDEAAEYLLAHGPKREVYNLYYWYYGTLAMFQHGGEPWARWNAQVRDGLVRRQRTSGHMAGSWDPDDSDYGKLGGRVYCTALAALTLEVYYRYLRLYDAPEADPLLAPAPDPVLRRAGIAGEATPKFKRQKKLRQSSTNTED
ncbi:MAG TPA: hypothetical protein VG406_14990 [Isosphaeraceae bacterium]|jgi:hypothetical protein|nr:hypothetical protein [Isosphaeraceae bacterium]